MNSRYHLSNDTVKHGYSNHAYDELMLTGKEFLFSRTLNSISTDWTVVGLTSNQGYTGVA